jgi:hypothetical protein
VYNRNLKIFRGVDNRIDIQVRNSDQKASNIAGSTLVFNLVNQATKDFVDRVTSFWLQEYKIDGIRFDYTKGFLNANAGNSALRQATIKRIGDTLWSLNPNAYLILEHWADNSEEKALSDYGFLLWGNSTYNFHQAGQGNAQSNFSWAYHGARGWTEPALVSYAESHDEERLMYEVLTYGNTTNVNHNPRQLATGLRRAEAVNLFAYLIPGPRMIWMFGELGYDISINNPCRVCNKPILWNYYQVPERRRLYDVTAAIFSLRKSHPATFRDGQFTYSFAGATKRMVFNSSGMDAMAIGNFAVSAQTIIPAFTATGVWYDYFSGDSITVSNVNAGILLKAGEYRLYTSTKLSQPQITLSEPEHVAVHGSESLEAVVFNEARDLNIDLIPVLEHAIDEGLSEVTGLTFDAVEVPDAGAFYVGGGFGVKVVCEEVLHRGQASVSSFSHE